MVKKLLIFFAYFLFFITLLVYFIPKVNLYYFIESKLKLSSAIISMEEVKDDGFNLNIKNAQISIKSVKSAQVSKIKLSAFFVYNKLQIQDITLSPMAEAFLPLKIQNVDIVLSILNPLNAHVYVIGEFGKAKGVYSILDNSINMKFAPSKIMRDKYKRTLNNLKKSENGEYIYVKNF